MRVQILVDVQEDTVSLMVQDDGPGISKGNQGEIFTPFFTTRRAEGGTGLGLSISQSLLERQGGRIIFQPGGEGACFRVILPRA